jgi:hypothetical protein
MGKRIVAAHPTFEEAAISESTGGMGDIASRSIKLHINGDICLMP